MKKRVLILCKGNSTGRMCRHDLLSETAGQKEAISMVNAGKTQTEIAEFFNVHRSTISRLVSERRVLERKPLGTDPTTRLSSEGATRIPAKQGHLARIFSRQRESQRPRNTFGKSSASASTSVKQRPILIASGRMSASGRSSETTKTGLKCNNWHKYWRQRYSDSDAQKNFCKCLRLKALFRTSYKHKSIK